MSYWYVPTIVEWLIVVGRAGVRRRCCSRSAVLFLPMQEPEAH